MPSPPQGSTLSVCSSSRAWRSARSWRKPRSTSYSTRSGTTRRVWPSSSRRRNSTRAAVSRALKKSIQTLESTTSTALGFRCGRARGIRGARLVHGRRVPRLRGFFGRGLGPIGGLVALPLELALPLQDFTVRGLPRQQAQAGLRRFLLGGGGACLHGLDQQFVVDIDVGPHDVYELINVPTSYTLHAKNAKAGVGDRRVQRRGQAQRQHAARVGRIDHAVVPEPGARVVRIG